MRHILIASLLSSFVLTAAAATKPANDASASTTTTATTARPVSTGVTAPQLIHSTHIEIPAESISNASPNPARVVLKLNLDQTGSPGNIEVVQPLSQQVDARVVAAVRQFRWSPAILDNQAIPLQVNLIVEVQR